MIEKGLGAAVGDQIVEDRPRLMAVMELVMELRAQEEAVTLDGATLEEGAVGVLLITMALHNQFHKHTLCR